MHTAPLLMIAAAFSGSVALTLSCSQEQHDLADWFPPGVEVGEGFVVKQRLARIEGLGGVHDIVLGRLGGDERSHLIVACKQGYLLLDPATGEERGRGPFESPRTLGASNIFGRPTIRDVDGDGALEFVLSGESWIDRTSVHGADGALQWLHPSTEDLSPNMTVCGDLDGDGALEFLMAFNATSEVDLLDAEGELIWRQEWSSLSSGSAHFVDTDGEGGLEIVYVDGAALWVRDREGAVLTRSVPPQGGYVNSLDVLDGWGASAEQHLLVGSNVTEGDQQGQQFYVFSLDGERVLETVTGRDLRAYTGMLPVRFAEAGEVFLARSDLLQRQAWPAGFDASRLRFQLYSAEHELVYDEILKDEAQEMVSGDGIFVIPSGGGGSSSRLLVAFGTSLWEYALPE